MRTSNTLYCHTCIAKTYLSALDPDLQHHDADPIFPLSCLSPTLHSAIEVLNL